MGTAEMTPGAESGKRKRPAGIACVSAFVVNMPDASPRQTNGHSSAAADRDVCQSCAVAVIGMLPSAAQRLADRQASARHAMRRRASARPSAAQAALRQGRERTATERRRIQDKDSAVGADAFEISFGDLPSPRVIEVIRAKEIHLPQWRILPSAQTPRALAGKKEKASAAAAAPEDDGDEGNESDDDRGDDETYMRRHTQTLERAMRAAISVARALAQKSREKEAAAVAKPSEGASSNMTEEERANFEERFRPSELAALFAAQRMDGAELLELEKEGTTAAGAAGFFGRGGANRNREREQAEKVEEGGEQPAAAAAEAQASAGAQADAAGEAEEATPMEEEEEEEEEVVDGAGLGVRDVV